MQAAASQLYRVASGQVVDSGCQAAAGGGVTDLLAGFRVAGGGLGA